MKAFVQELQVKPELAFVEVRKTCFSKVTAECCLVFREQTSPFCGSSAGLYLQGEGCL